MKIVNLLTMVLLWISIITFIGCETKTTLTEKDPVERGEYLVLVGGCNDCHTPKIQGPGGMPMLDTTRILSGHPADMPHPTWSPQDLQQRNALTLANPMFTAWAGPWGVSFTQNLTPDKETGLGEWTEEAFMQALRTGKHQGQPDGRDILPPMPWEPIGQMTDKDLKAVWAYLQSLPAVNNQVPTPIPPAGAPMEK
jgi:mono/diheme cytochrome c family protein